MSTVRGGQGNIVQNGLRLWFDFANPNCYSGNTIYINNLTGRTGNNAILKNGAVYSGNSNGCISFDGPRTYQQESRIDFTIHNGYEYPYTTNCWLKTSYTGSAVGIIKSPIWGELEDSSMSSFGLDSGYTAIHYYNYTGNVWSVVTTDIFLADGKWHYFSFYLKNNYPNSGTWKVWVDGINRPVPSGVLPGLFGIWLDCIGSHRYGGGFIGAIGHATLYNRLLTDSEVLQNYNATRARFGV